MVILVTILFATSGLLVRPHRRHGGGGKRRKAATGSGRDRVAVTKARKGWSTVSINRDGGYP